MGSIRSSSELEGGDAGEMKSGGLRNERSAHPERLKNEISREEESRNESRQTSAQIQCGERAPLTTDFTGITGSGLQSRRNDL